MNIEIKLVVSNSTVKESDLTVSLPITPEAYEEIQKELKGKTYCNHLKCESAQTVSLILSGIAKINGYSNVINWKFLNSNDKYCVSKDTEAIIETLIKNAKGSKKLIMYQIQNSMWQHYNKEFHELSGSEIDDYFEANKKKLYDKYIKRGGKHND